MLVGSDLAFGFPSGFDFSIQTIASVIGRKVFGFCGASSDASEWYILMKPNSKSLGATSATFIGVLGGVQSNRI